MIKMNRKVLASASAVALALATGAANAAIDVTAATADIGDAKTGVIAVGLAVFGVALGVKLYKWVKSAL